MECGQRHGRPAIFRSRRTPSLNLELKGVPSHKPQRERRYPRSYSAGTASSWISLIACFAIAVNSPIAAQPTPRSGPGALLVVRVASVAHLVTANREQTDRKALPLAWRHGAIAVWAAVPNDVPFKPPLLSATDREGFIIYRNDPHSIAWRAVAVTVTEVYEPGREVGIPAFWIPTPPYFHVHVTSLLPLNPQIFATVTQHPCRDLVATVLVNGIGGYELLNIAALGARSPERPCVGSTSLLDTGLS